MVANVGQSVKSQRANLTRAVKRSRKGARPYRNFADSDKVAAVTAALSANLDHPMSKVSLDAAIAVLGAPIHHGTLGDWLKIYSSIVKPTLIAKPIDQVISEARDTTLSNMLKAKDIAMQQLLDETKAKAASYRDSGVVMGILHDKIEASIGLSPSMVATVQAWERICNALGLDAEGLIRANTEKLQALQSARLAQAALPSSGEISSDNAYHQD